MAVEIRRDNNRRDITIIFDEWEELGPAIRDHVFMIGRTTKHVENEDGVMVPSEMTPAEVKEWQERRVHPEYTISPGALLPAPSRAGMTDYDAKIENETTASWEGRYAVWLSGTFLDWSINSEVLSEMAREEQLETLRGVIEEYIYSTTKDLHHDAAVRHRNAVNKTRSLFAKADFENWI